jgi:cyclophilin family peptidyl-prolyl cis-trans isomerase
VSKATKRERQKENRERARVERDRLVKRDRQMKTLRGFAILAAIFVAGLLIINALSSSDSGSAFDKNKFYTATVQTSEGDIAISLDAKNAPIATKHFIDLVDKKYYDGLCIDRLARDFVIQGGSPKCDQQGGAGKSVNGEVPKDHYPVGSLAAAKGGSDPAGTFDAQFFLVTGSQGATLPNDYARFGSIISGLDVAQKIEQMPIAGGGTDGKPVSKITIKRIRIASTNKAPTAASTSSSTPSTSKPATP